MNPNDVNLLACPETGSPLELQASEMDSVGLIVTGALVSPLGRRYPIVRGIPRFVGEQSYANSFGYEWNRWPRVQFEDQNVGRKMAGHTTRMWHTITGMPAGEVREKTIVEFGCGSGRFLDVVRRQGGRAVGIDMSQAVEAARQNFAQDRDVLIVQGDVLRPPFRAGAFDGGYSIGVLHHTPHPELGLRKLAASISASGWLSVCVYPKGEFYDYPSVARFRRLHHRLRGRWSYRPAMIYSHFSAYALAWMFRKTRKLPGGKRLNAWLQREWLVCLDLPDRRWSVLDIFDAITPSTASTHTSDEVSSWLQQAGCTNIRQTPWCSTSFAANVSAAGVARAA